MTYIKQEDREEFKDILAALTYVEMNSEKLDFLITAILKMYIAVNGRSYENFNTLLGVIENVKSEFCRKDVARFQEESLEKNGLIDPLECITNDG